jgi:Tol biopolymer transport system component
VVTTVLLIAASAVGMTFVGNSLFAPADAQLRATVWSGEKGGQVGPVWSPDSRATVYGAAAAQGEDFQLRIRELGAPAARSIAHREDPPVPVQWTAEGKILFVDATGLWSVSPAGTAPERIRSFDWASFAPPGVLLERALDVSRNGQAMAYIARGADGRAGVFTAALPTGEASWYIADSFATRDLRANPFLRFSPDGTQLLLWWNAGRGAEEAWILPFPPDSANPPRRVLERMPVIFGTPEFSWLPDNRHVVVSGGPEHRRPGPRELFVADTRSGRFKLLLSGTSAKRHPVVSPNGAAFVYTDLEANYDVVTFDPQTSGVTPVVDSLRWEQMPAWAAQAPVLAYITAPDNAPEVWLHEPGRPDRPFATRAHFPDEETTFFEAPAPSPDGRHVIYQRVAGPNAKSSHLWMSGVDGSRPERLTTSTDWETGGSWSPDGQWFAYFVQEDGLNVLKKARTSGQATPEIVLAGHEDERGLFWLPVWSPDGEWILVPDRGILVSADGSETRSLGLDPRTQSCWVFAPKAPELYCIDAPQDDGRYPLVARGLDGGLIRTIGSLTEQLIPRATLFPPALRFSPTPDGNGLTYSVLAGATTNLWLMEGLDELELP